MPAAHPSYKLSVLELLMNFPWSNQFAGQHVHTTYADRRISKDFDAEWTVINAPGFLKPIQI